MRINFELNTLNTHCDSHISETYSGTNTNAPPLARPDSNLDMYNCHGHTPYSIKIQLIYELQERIHKYKFTVANRIDDAEISSVLTAFGNAMEHKPILRPKMSAIE